MKQPKPLTACETFGLICCGLALDRILDAIVRLFS